MKIESLNTFGHDGSYVLLEDETLVCSIEGEKDSQDRQSLLNEEKINQLSISNPDIKVSCYPLFGVDGSIRSSRNILGVEEFRSSHERAHIMCAYGMSPYPQGQPCYVLCYEGQIGRFYYIDESLSITKFPTTLVQPGFRYESVFELANNRLSTRISHSAPGKLMALTGFARKQGNKWSDFINKLLDVPPLFQLEKNWKEYNLDSIDIEKGVDKEIIKFLTDRTPEFTALCDPLKNMGGVESQEFKDFSHYFSQAIFDRFYNDAKKFVTKKIPLLITGGCGLNCDWNTQWKECGLFSDVFIPPVCNDSGIAIGLAVDAQWSYIKKAKINWSPYTGEEFIDDISLEYQSLNLEKIVSLLLKGEIVAWVQGKYEIGPRALCHRSLLSSPFDAAMQDKLNKIKQRENYRPIAPVCIENEVSKFFDWSGPSPYMLQFMDVKNPNLKAVTHVDGTARTQTLNKEQDEKTYNLLKSFEVKTGYPILCNTSLNFLGKGFINRMSDLKKYTMNAGINVIVVNNRMYISGEKNE
jgi:hydroxymethyl cephem carbamoyltransferase